MLPELRGCLSKPAAERYLQCNTVKIQLPALHLDGHRMTASGLTCSDAYCSTDDPGGQQSDAAAEARDTLHGRNR